MHSALALQLARRSQREAEFDMQKTISVLREKGIGAQNATEEAWTPSSNQRRYLIHQAIKRRFHTQSTDESEDKELFLRTLIRSKKLTKIKRSARKSKKRR